MKYLVGFFFGLMASGAVAGGFQMINTGDNVAYILMDGQKIDCTILTPEQMKDLQKR